MSTGHRRGEEQKAGLWTLPNLLSMVRLAGIPVFLWLVLGPEWDGWALLLLMVAGITDYLDGYLARRLQQSSRFGEILDPVADRLYILAVVIGLFLRDIIPWGVAVALPARDLFLWCLVPFLRTRGYSSLPVHFLGKAATFNLLYAFPLLLLGDGDGVVATLAQVFGWAFAIWGIGLYWWAGMLYAYQVYLLLRSPAHADASDPEVPEALGRPVPPTEVVPPPAEPVSTPALAEDALTGSVSVPLGKPTPMHVPAPVDAPVEVSTRSPGRRRRADATPDDLGELSAPTADGVTDLPNAPYRGRRRAGPTDA